VRKTVLSGKESQYMTSTASVVKWSELLAADQEALGSVSGATSFFVAVDLERAPLTHARINEELFE
jgi:hypothetical protein